MTGFGIAYDAAVRALAVREQMVEDHGARHVSRSHRARTQMLSHIFERDRKRGVIESIQAQLADDSLRPTERHCPECSGEFVMIKAEEVELDACLPCGSFWLDAGEMKTVTHRVADTQTLEGAVAPSRYRCPICETQMEQHRFVTHNDLLVDKCPNEHGIYLERDELVRSIEM